MISPIDEAEADLGYCYLYTGVDDAVEAEPSTELAEIVSALQEVAPAAPPGAAGSAGVDPTASEWIETWALVQDACNEAMGITDPIDGFGIEGWVGG